NPRLQSTTGLLNAIQHEAYLPSFAVLHILEHLGVSYQLDVSAYNRVSATIPAVDCAQMVIFNKGCTGRVSGALRPGVYSADNGIHFVRPGFWILDIPPGNNFLLTRALLNGQRIRQHKMMYIVQTRRSLLDSSKRLNPWAKNICMELRRACRIDSTEWDL
ncbi:MAG: hypothetical protein MN733_21515, partial [Nitrososphaera sp.]|nr:hypothetical protein [Nitrososphaera sp.]